MRILHYFLGFPPYRSGGLTKYCMDLMLTQVERGNIVSALWPGRMGLLQNKVSICEKKSMNGIINYELLNPLPVPLDEGIIDTQKFMQPCDERIYYDYISVVKPDIIHIHTLMGLHKELISVSEKLGIKTVFTTHDYFGICPKVTLYKNGMACDCDHNYVDCINCNQTALSLRKIHVLQSRIYRNLKNSKIVRSMRKSHRNNFHGNEELPKLQLKKEEQQRRIKNYKTLRLYYLNILSSIDMIHFNSNLTKKIYCRYVSPKSSRVISITHSGIADHRQIKTFDSPVLRLTCLAPAKPFKGYTVIKTALDNLWESGFQDFQLNLFGYVPHPSPYMKVVENGYQYEELSKIFAETDCLLALSVSYETFGFTVLEALSYGVPVIVSDHVGAQDVVRKGGIIILAGSVAALEDAIRSLSSDQLHAWNDKLMNDAPVKTWDKLVNEINELYQIENN